MPRDGEAVTGEVGEWERTELDGFLFALGEELKGRRWAGHFPLEIRKTKSPLPLLHKPTPQSLPLNRGTSGLI